MKKLKMEEVPGELKRALDEDEPVKEKLTDGDDKPVKEERLGGDLFWRVFALRSCTYLDSHYLARIADYERFVKNIPGEKCSGCYFPVRFETQTHIKCAKCLFRMSCGKPWCKTYENSQTRCSACDLPHCAKCLKKCANECDNKVCNNCAIKCPYCRDVMCREHVSDCCGEADCKILLFCGCRTDVDEHMRRFHSKRAKIDE